MRILAVIDMQNDFIDGPLGTPEAVAVVGREREKIARCREEGDRIVFTRDTHGEGYLDTQEGRKLPVVHCLAHSRGWEIAEGLYQDGDKIIDKPSFGSLALADYIGQIKQLESVELVGLCTDICVISNAIILKAKLPEIRVAVDGSCCAGVTPQSHENALEAMRACQIEVKFR